MSKIFNQLQFEHKLNESILSSIKTAFDALRSNLTKAFNGVGKKLKDLKLGETHAVPISIPHPVMENVDFSLDKVKTMVAQGETWKTMTNYTGFLNEKAIIASMFDIPTGFKDLIITDKGKEVSKSDAKKKMDEYLEASLLVADHPRNENKTIEWRDSIKNVYDSAPVTAEVILKDAEQKANEHGNASSFSCIVEFSGVEGMGKEKADLRVLFKKEEEDDPHVIIKASLKKYYSNPAKTKVADKAFPDGTQTSALGLMFWLYYGPGQANKVKRVLKFVGKHHSDWSRKQGFHIRHSLRGPRNKKTDHYDMQTSFQNLKKKTGQDITKLKDIDGFVNTKILIQHMFQKLGMDWGKYEKLIDQQAVGIVEDKRGDLLKAFNMMLMEMCSKMYDRMPHAFVNHIFAMTGFFEDQYMTVGQKGMFKVYSSINSSNPMGTGQEKVIWDMVENKTLKMQFKDNMIHVKDDKGEKIHNPIYINLRGGHTGTCGAVDCSYFLDPDTEVIYSSNLQKTQKVLDNVAPPKTPGKTEFNKQNTAFQQHLKFDDFKF